ncbi:uncharacterized protein [Salminus brasiliensis]|uniref:uncharacterized protein n=1 Tax=Salminus brasiliensis TaxID=930266 RepID=UPI003B832008
MFAFELHLLGDRRWIRTSVSSTDVPDVLKNAVPLVVNRHPFRLRPVIYITGATTAACFLLRRWTRTERRRTGDAPAHTAHFEALQELASPPRPREVFLLSEELWCGPLFTYRKDVQRASQTYALTFTQQFSNGEKQVEVTLQQKSVYSGLESVHWWVLTNQCFNLFPVETQLPPQHFGTVKVVAFIKRVGHQVCVVEVQITTESSITSLLRTQTLQTKASSTFKGVVIGEGGCFRSSESSNTNFLETQMIPQPPARPLGPPPGFH